MKRYLCQFRDIGKDYFITDCGFDDLEQAKMYVNKVVTVLWKTVVKGQVFDYETREIIYSR